MNPDISDLMRQLIDLQRNNPPDDALDDYQRGYSWGLYYGLESAINLLDEWQRKVV